MANRTVRVALLPQLLSTSDLKHRAVVVFDVLRATTTMSAALAAGIRYIHAFDSIDAARAWAADHTPRPLLCGEVRCLRPAGFDLGNSPRQFQKRRHGGRDICISTTNGTRALVAASEAKHILAGALVNAAAVARWLAKLDVNVTFLCAGTNGEVANEDLLGAGAVLRHLPRRFRPDNDAARLAVRLFDHCSSPLALLTEAQGGQNLIRARLRSDIAFAARLNSLDSVPMIDRSISQPLTLRAG